MSIYLDEYKRKLTTPEQAVASLASGQTVVHGTVTAEPPALLAAMAQRLRESDISGVKVYSLLPMGHATRTILAPDLCDRVIPHSWFVSAGDRKLVGLGLNYFVANDFHEVPRLITDFMDLDLVVTTVSPMDNSGHFSFGLVNDYTSTAARHCKRLVVEVNPRMPRVFGDSLLHVSEVDAIVEHEEAIPEVLPGDVKPEAEIIGKAIAEMVPDGATIQLGFGAIPAAVGAYLGGHRDLGIHSELMCPAMADLIKQGVITGRNKTLHPRLHVFTNALGDQALYDFLHDNPSMASHPVSYTNSPGVIAKNADMISINATIEVDLLGQCNSEFMAGQQYSGSGGQLDFVRGAFDAPRGKSIIAFYATAKGGAVSRIVPRLETGTVVTTPRNAAHWLATEYGAACLKGKSTRERALAIIDLAHPTFRDDLLREADNLRLL
jgi:itaconate CoA-transferase